MRKKQLFLVLLIVGVGVLAGFLYIQQNKAELQGMVEAELCQLPEGGRIAEQTEEEQPKVPMFLYTNYLDVMEAGTGPGDQLAPLTLTNSKGEKVQLFNSEKKVLLTYGTVGCESCHQMYPILKEWAKRYGADLEVVVVFRGPAPDSEIEPLVEAGIQVIPDEEQVKMAIHPGNTYENLLIDEQGQVLYRFPFAVDQWQKYEEMLAEWMESDRLSEEQTRMGLAVGEPLPVEEFRDATGETFDLEKWQGRAVLLFLASPGDLMSKFTYPVVAEMQEKYGDEVQMALIFDYSDPGRTERVREYYQRYGLKSESGTEAVSGTLEEIREQTGLTDLPIYFDGTGEFFRASRAQVLPAMMALDQESQLIGIYGFTTSDCCGFIGEKAEVVVAEALQGL